MNDFLLNLIKSMSDRLQGSPLFIRYFPRIFGRYCQGIFQETFLCQATIRFVGCFLSYFSIGHTNYRLSLNMCT